jgi:hypothetical protein
MVAVRDKVLGFAVKLQLIVPVSVPLAPDVIESQVSPDLSVSRRHQAIVGSKQ